MSEKKKTVVLGVVGAASALGLGWLLSRVIGGNGGNGGGNGGGDSCGAGYHWDAALGGCVPDDIPVDPTLDMDPDAIWARANEVCSDADNLGRPPVRVTGFNFKPSAPGQRQVLKNLWYWDNEFNTRPNSISYYTQSGYLEFRGAGPEICVVDTYCDTYLGGGTWCNYEERPAGEMGQLVRQYSAFDPAAGYVLFEWQGHAWVQVFISPYINDALFKHQNGVKVEYLSIGKADVTLISDVDYIIPPDMLHLDIAIDHPGDALRIPQLYGAPNTPGPSFLYGTPGSLDLAGVNYGSDDASWFSQWAPHSPMFNPADRSTWLNLRAGVPYTIRDVPMRAYIYGSYTRSMYGGDRSVAAGAYQGGSLAPGAYSAKVRLGFLKACVMLYNRDWYYPPTTEQDYYTGDLGVYDKIASYTIGQNELLHDNLKFWHIRPMVCDCYQTVQFYHPQGQSTVETPKNFTINYPFTAAV
jgi:hypothetical protein